MWMKEKKKKELTISEEDNGTFDYVHILLVSIQLARRNCNHMIIFHFRTI